MRFATQVRRTTGREADRMQTGRPPSDGRHRAGPARAVEVAGPQPFAVEVQRRDAVVAPAAPVDRAIQLCGLDKKLPFVAAVDAEPDESASGPQGDE